MSEQLNKTDRLKLLKDALMQRTSVLATFQKATDNLRQFETDLANSDRCIIMTPDNEDVVREALLDSVAMAKKSLDRVEAFAELVGGAA